MKAFRTYLDTGLKARTKSNLLNHVKLSIHVVICKSRKYSPLKQSFGAFRDYEQAQYLPSIHSIEKGN